MRGIHVISFRQTVKDKSVCDNQLSFADLNEAKIFFLEKWFLLRLKRGLIIDAKTSEEYFHEVMYIV